MGVSALRSARVFLGRKALGMLLLFSPLTSERYASIAFVLITVSTRAMFLRVCLILPSFDAAPPVTCATRSCGEASKTESRG